MRLEDIKIGEAQRLGSNSYPSLFQNLDTGILDIPQYDVRQRWQARDGLCGIEAFRVWILRVLPILFGIRMCPFCPDCNHAENFQDHSNFLSCQDIFGSSMMAIGGFCGGSDAIGGAVEHQHDGNPHYHGHVHIVNVFQHNPLQTILEMIKQKAIDPQTVLSYHQCICNETHPDIDHHNKDITRLEKEWPQYRSSDHHRFKGLFQRVPHTYIYIYIY